MPLRQVFTEGWVPDADESAANVALRADNCVQGIGGELRPRPGCAKVNVTALADTDVNSIFSIGISGTKTRFVGAGDNVYVNGTSTGTSLAGSGDVIFGSHMGQVFYTRSTDHYKHDGTTERTWGIAAPSAAPTLSALSADSKTFATCNSTESPGFTANEGSVAFANDRNAVANASAALTPDATTGRGSMTLTYASPTDFTAYDGGETQASTDIFDFFAYITEPQYVSGIEVLIDINDGTFEEDYYSYRFTPGTDESFTVDAEDELSYDQAATGFLRGDISGRAVAMRRYLARIREDVAGGWSHFSIPITRFVRTGGTSGKNWTTVKAIRVSFVATQGGAGSIIRFDDIKVIGGSGRRLTGRFVAKIVPVYNNGTYNAIGVPSDATSEIEVKANGIRATVSAATVQALDSQVTELWLFLYGGRLDQYYRFATLTGGPWTTQQTIDAEVGEISAMISNITLQENNTTPPDNIIDIEGPHYDRILCLTEQYLYPSRPLNPDSFDSGEVIRVGSETETALWIVKLAENVYLGTTRDVYRFDGDWTLQPDDVLNVYKRPMGVLRPPISSAHVTGRINGEDVIIYMTGDGWQVLGGPLLTEDRVSRLWNGESRHSVSAVNVTSSGARFRGAIAGNRLIALTPEGSSTTSSQVLHVYDFTRNRWYRWTYGYSILSLFTESDGTLLSGDNAGFYRTMDLAATTDDGSNFTSTIWTPLLDVGSALEQWVRSARLEVTGTGSVTVTPWLRGSAQTAASVTVAAADRKPEARFGREAHGKEVRYVLSGTGSWALRGVTTELSGEQGVQ